MRKIKRVASASLNKMGQQSKKEKIAEILKWKGELIQVNRTPMNND
jgi:hypothetical protein